MPTVNNDVPNESKNIHHLIDAMNETGKVFCGVQRKVNIGNFESIDVYCAASVPVEIEDPQDKEELHSKLIEAMEDMISITSKVTAEKYEIIKSQTNS